MTGRRGRLKQLPDELREKRRYWKLKEKALAGCVWWTRFGRSYGPVADRLRDDDDDDDDDDNTNMYRSKGGPWMQWQWDAMGNIYVRVIQLFAVSTPYDKVPYSYCSQLCIIWQFTKSLNVISFFLSISNFTYLYWNGHMNYSSM